jgi:hypothetical protein
LGAVVYDQDFEVVVGLGEDALDGFGEEVRLVVARDHHADQSCTSTVVAIKGLVEAGHSESPVEV